MAMRGVLVTMGCRLTVKMCCRGLVARSDELDLLDGPSYA